MSKLSEIKEYLNKNINKDKCKLIKFICSNWNVTEKSANIYYSQWRSEFLNNKNKKVVINIKEEKIFKQFKEIGQVVEGDVGEYIVVNKSVIYDDTVFKNEADIEKYKQKQLKRFYGQLGEILDLLEKIKA